MAKGGPENVTQTNAPPTYAAPYLESLARSSSQLYGGGQLAPVTGFDAEQLKAQQAMLDFIYGPQAQQTVSQAQTSLGGLLGAADLQNNPYISPYIAEQNRLITQAYEENLLPSITGEAVLSGGIGGSRQGVAQGLAAGRTAQAIGSSTAQQLSEAYKTGLGAQSQGLALAPGITQLPINLFGVGESVGAARRDLVQQREEAPLVGTQRYAELLRAASGNYGDITTPGAKSNPALGALGGAAAGASIGSEVGSVGGPWGAAIGGIIGLLASS